MTDVELIKSRLNITDIVNEYIQLKPAGANMKALCPFHDEKTPSFMVHCGKQIFHCFGCNEGGDIFTFIQKQENVEFPEALRILAQKAGVKLKTYNPEQENLKTRLKDILAAAVKYYEEILWSNTGNLALNYLINERGLNQDTLKSFNIGYALHGWDNLSKFFKGKKFNSKDIIKSGLVIQRQTFQDFYDRFRERIMFPIFDIHGIPVGFTGRLLPEKEKDPKSGGKYINTPETPIYHKTSLLYGLDKAKSTIREMKSTVLVEGQMDVISSHQAGVKNVVASSGTALTPEQFSLIKRLSNKIIFALDTDSAGLQALKRAITIAWSNDLNTAVIRLPQAIKDPAELIKQNPVAWQKAVESSVSFIDYYLNLIFNKFQLDNSSGKKQAAQEILPIIKLIPDPIERANYINIISEKLQVDSTYIKEAIERINNHSQIKIRPRLITNRETIPAIENYNQLILALGLKYPELALDIVKYIKPETYQDSKYEEFYREFYNWYNNKTEINNDSQFTLTKNLAKQRTILELLAEREFGSINLDQAQTEWQKILKLRQKYLINQELKIIEAKLKQLETSPEDEASRINQLIQYFNDLTLKLRQLS